MAHRSEPPSTNVRYIEVRRVLAHSGSLSRGRHASLPAALPAARAPRAVLPTPHDAQLLSDPPPECWTNGAPPRLSFGSPSSRSSAARTWCSLIVSRCDVGSSSTRNGASIGKDVLLPRVAAAHRTTATRGRPRGSPVHLAVRQRSLPALPDATPPRSQKSRAVPQQVGARGLAGASRPCQRHGCLGPDAEGHISQRWMQPGRDRCSSRHRTSRPIHSHASRLRMVRPRSSLPRRGPRADSRVDAIVSGS